MTNNLEYIKDKTGDVKVAILKTDKSVDIPFLRKLSLEQMYTMYSIPETVSVEFNDNGSFVKASGHDVKNIWQFVNGWAMPYQCFVNGFPFPVKMEEMWNSKKEVSEVDVEELMWNLEFPWWNTDEDSVYNLTPKEVLENLDKYSSHKERILRAELEYPLLLVQTKQNRWLIYDGVHRFVKSLLEGRRSILAKRFTMEEMGKYINELDRGRFESWKTS